MDYWWSTEISPETRATTMWEHARALEEQQASVHYQNLINARLYSNRELTAFAWGHDNITLGTLEPVSRTAENLVLSIVDVMTASLCKQKVVPRAMTRRGTYTQQRKAKQLSLALAAEFQHKVHTRQAVTERDRLLFGFNCWWVDIDDGKICVERVFPDEIIVDHTECISDPEPMQVFRRRVLPLESVVAMYADGNPELAAKIADMAAQRAYTSYRWPGEGHVVVVEGIRKATAAGPGRRVVSVRDLPLEDEEWPHPWFPAVFARFQEPITGFYAPSAVETILPYQLRLNEVNLVIKDAQDIMARPRLLVANGSQVNLMNLDNRIARVISYTGVRPEAVTWQAVSAELYNERDRVVRNAFEFFGLSQLQGLQRLPAGARLDSAPALREATEKNDDRFATLSESLESSMMQLGERIIQVASNYARGWKGHPGQSIRTCWGKGHEYVDFDWAKFDLGEEEYALQLAPVSVFSLSPAARQDTAAFWLSAQIIDKARYLSIVDNPDLENETATITAADEDIADTIERLSTGERVVATPMQDLVNGVMRVSAAYHKTMLSMRRDKSITADHRNTVEGVFLAWLEEAKAIMQNGTENGPQQHQAPVTAGPQQ